MKTVKIPTRGGDNCFSGAIGTLLHKAGLVPSYQDGADLAKTGTVVIASDWFKTATVQSDREMVNFEGWCDITVNGQTTRAIVED